VAVASVDNPTIKLLPSRAPAGRDGASQTETVTGSAPAAARHDKPTSSGAQHPGGDHPIIDLRSVSKIYNTGEVEVVALRRVSLRVERGDFVAIMGASGSGKSTMMNIIGCLDVPTSGHFWLDGVDVRSLHEGQLALVRNRKIGFVFQSFNLIPRTSALDNVELPLAYAGVKPKERRRRAMEALQAVGLGQRMQHLPNEMSGGQQQRAAVARAIVTNPSLVLADEPTGNLDTASSNEVMRIMSHLNAAGRTIVLITHEPDIAEWAKRVVRMRDGRIYSDERRVAVSDPPPEGVGEVPNTVLLAAQARTTGATAPVLDSNSGDGGGLR
jgi:putative ABC transport system ATP-binding protein